MDELAVERLLQRNATTTTYPPTPSLRASVLAAIASPSSAVGPDAYAPRFVVRGALAAVLVVFGTALALPSSRSAIAEFFGVEGSKIERLPPPADGGTPTPLPPPTDIGAYGRPSTLADASAALGFAPAFVPGADDPEVFVARYPSEGIVILRYGAFDLWQMRTREVFFGKGLPEGVVVVDTAVGGRPARWIEGGPHTAGVFDENGIIPGSERTVARDTLIWRTDTALYRLETTLPLSDAQRVAEWLP